MDRHVRAPKLDPFLRSFTVEHRAQPVTLEVLDGATWRVQESGLPLVGLDLDTRGRYAPSLEIILGDETSGEKRHMTHSVRRVRHVTVEKNDLDEDRRLVIDGEDGSRVAISID